MIGGVSKQWAALRVAALVALTSLLAGGAVVAAPAAAASDGVLVSSDGVHFAPTLSTDLFAGLGLLAPGESVSSALWIRNDSDVAASMRVRVKDLVVPSKVFARGVTLTTVGKGSDFDQAWSVGDLEKCKVVVPTARVKSGETVKIGLTFTMLDLDGIRAQTESAHVDLAVTMRDRRGGEFSSDPCSDRMIDAADLGDGGDTDTADGGSLPFTGQGIRSDLIIAAALLVGIGWFLVVWKRRRREDETDDVTLVP